MGQFDLEAHANEIGTLFIGYVDDEATCQIVQYIGRYRMILFNSIRIGIHGGSTAGVSADCRVSLDWFWGDVGEGDDLVYSFISNLCRAQWIVCTGCIDFSFV